MDIKNRIQFGHYLAIESIARVRSGFHNQKKSEVKEGGMYRKFYAMFLSVALASLLAGCPGGTPPCIQKGEQLVYGWEYKENWDGKMCPVNQWKKG